MAAPAMITTLTNLSIWDGEKHLDANALRLNGSQIEQIGEASALSQGARLIDCRGLTAMPGLIDAHVHLELNPDDKDPPDKTDLKIAPIMAERAAAMVAAGITTARDLGGGAWLELSLRDAINRGEAIGPRLICSGQPVTSPQGHCHFWNGVAADFEEAKVVMQRQLEHDVDLIKVMATGGRLTRGSKPTDVQFGQDTLSRIVDFAHAHGKRVAAHCHGTHGIHQAAIAGVNTIEHCSWVGAQGWASDYQPDVADLIASRGIWVSPTVNRGWQRMLDNTKGAVLARVRSAYQNMMNAGIPLIASTDAGIPGVYHMDLPHALLVFAQIAGLSAQQTLTSATRDCARAIGLGDQTGTLAAGMAADLLLVHGDPLADLAVITDPAAIWARGRQIKLAI
ncbi:MAG: amidohydrolase family protein [Proteobacteria bacterium]|nr:amidohydrolase family protein [Pseudomonadota bacterium]